MRIGIIGIGAMGCLFAARLEPLAEIVMLGHWAEQIETLRARGLTYEGPEGKRRRVTVKVVESAAETGPVAVALVLVKSYQTGEAAVTAGEILNGDGIAITLQNGLGNVETLAATVGAERAVPGATTEGATLVRPGIVRHAGTGHTYLGSPHGVNNARLQATASLFNDAGFETEVSKDVDSVLWGKLTVNAAINPLTAVLGVRNGFLAESDAARRVMLAVAREAAEVADVHGVSLPYDPERMALEVARRTSQNRSSMLQDLQNGRMTEVEAINGSIVRLGRAHDVPTPLNDIMVRLVATQCEGAGRQQSLKLLEEAGDRPEELFILRQLLQEVSQHGSMQDCQ